MSDFKKPFVIARDLHEYNRRGELIEAINTYNEHSLQCPKSIFRELEDLHKNLPKHKAK